MSASGAHGRRQEADATASASGPPDNEVEVVRTEEELRVRRVERPFGTARVRTDVVTREVHEVVDLMADDVEVVEVPVPSPETDSGEVETTAEGDLSVPVLAERLVLRTETYVQKRIVLRRTRRPHAREQIDETLRAGRLTIEVDHAPTPEERSAARHTGGEDLSRGPTPRTRHPDGGHDDVRDTTQGPTPEIRRVMRSEGTTDSRAAGQPARDRPTRAERGGDQDREDSATVTERMVVEPDDPVVVVEPSTDPPRP